MSWNVIWQNISQALTNQRQVKINPESEISCYYITSDRCNK